VIEGTGAFNIAYGRWNVRKIYLLGIRRYAKDILTFRLKCTRHNYLSYQRRLKMDDFLLMSVMKQIMFQVLFNQKRAVFFISGPFPATTEAV
jgi:hypothetical protein